MGANHRTNTSSLVMAVLALCCVVAVAWLYVSSLQHIAVSGLLGLKLVPVFYAAIILVLGLGFGSLLVAGRRPAQWLSFATIQGAGLFLGLVSLSTFLLGEMWLLPLVAAAAVVLYRYRKGGPLVPQEDESLTGAIGAGTSGPWPLFAVISAFALLSFLCAFASPWEYDEQEYHLGSVAYYLRHVRAYCVPENVYSHFPQNVEMWFYGLTRIIYPCSAKASWTSDMLDGIYAGKLINVALGLLTAFLVGWAARRCEKGDAAPKDVKSCVPYAMSFFYCSPAILFFSGIAFVEMALTFYLFLALCTFLVYTSVEPSQSWGRIRCAIICGIICGLAAGCKYTAILFGAAPLAIFFLIENSKRGTAAFLPGVRDAAAFLLAALIAFSPWLIRNLVITGNPVFPLLYSLLGGRGWDVAHNAMWVKAHAPGPITLSEFGGSLWGFLANSAFTPLLAFLFIPLLAFRPRVLSAAGRWVFAYAYSYCIFWFLFTHGVDRFLAPALPAFAVLSAVGFAAWQEGWVGKALKGVVVICLVFTLYQGLIVASNLGAFTVGLHPREHENFMRDNTDFYDVYQAIKFLNENSDKAKARVLFLGEARAFYCNADWLAPTVFNTNPLESALRECATPHEAAARLTGQGFTHILVNWSEFQRLQKTYSAFQDFDIRKWEAFQKACFEPLASFGKPDKAGAYPILVYAIRPKL